MKNKGQHNHQKTSKNNRVSLVSYYIINNNNKQTYLSNLTGSFEKSRQSLYFPPLVSRAISLAGWLMYPLLICPFSMSCLRSLSAKFLRTVVLGPNLFSQNTFVLLLLLALFFLNASFTRSLSRQSRNAAKMGRGAVPLYRLLTAPLWQRSTMLKASS